MIENTVNILNTAVGASCSSIRYMYAPWLLHASPTIRKMFILTISRSDFSIIVETISRRYYTVHRHSYTTKTYTHHILYVYIFVWFLLVRNSVLPAVYRLFSIYPAQSCFRCAYSLILARTN